MAEDTIAVRWAGLAVVGDTLGRPARMVWLQLLLAQAAPAGRTVAVCLERPWSLYAAAASWSLGRVDVWGAAELAGPLVEVAARGVRAGRQGGVTVLAVDTLTPLIERFGLGPTLRLLRQWAADLDASLVLALVHTDLHTPLQAAQLEAAADVWVSPVPDETRVDVPEPMLYPAPPALGPWTAQARWTDPAVPGKRRIAQAVVGSSGNMHSNSLVWTSRPAAAAMPQAAAPVSGGPRTTSAPPAVSPSSLTFNVSLTAQQRDARAQVVLPYGPSPLAPLGTPVAVAAAAAVAAATASVIYHAEAEDDLDEDDPDADLDI